MTKPSADQRGSDLEVRERSSIPFGVERAFKSILRFCMGLAVLVAAPQTSLAAATPQERAQVLSIAATIEKDAKATTYDDLGPFGQEALKLRGAEKFVRLQYVSEEYFENLDIPKFQHWNKVLSDEANREKSVRYAKIAEIDQTMLRALSGDAAAMPRITEFSEKSTDWYVKAHALLQQANLASALSRMNDSLLLVSEAESLIRGGGIEASYMRFEIHESRALRLLAIYDLYGAAKIMEQAAQIYHGLKLPRPNSQELFNMAMISIRLGDKDLAEKLIASHLRLARPTDGPNERLTYATMCVSKSDAFGTPQDVLDCVTPVKADMELGHPLALGLTFQRGLASARLGKVEDAERDFATLKAIKAQHVFPDDAFLRLPLLDAELKAARGDYQGSLQLIRTHLKTIAVADAQIYDASRREITEEYTRNLDLRAQLVKSQRAIIALALAVLAGGAVMLALQIRLANRYRIQRQKAEAATEAKGEFLSNMSHEIRTPLTAIIGFAELLGERRDLPEDARSQVRKIVDGGNALLLIVNDVLDFSKIETGQLELETTPFNPSDVVSRAVGLVEGMAEAKGLALTFEPAPDLPEFVAGDAGRLRQAILNLVNNAVKFTASGSVRVSLDYDASAERLACSVIDTGPGIPADRQNLLFKRFSQIDSSVSRVYGGSGLGLAITRSLVELMGGEITVDSKEGEGSTFSFYVKAPIAGSQPDEGITSGPTANLDDRQGQVVLIVDDREENREILSQMIASVGLSPVVAESGEEALSLALQTRYDLILMDVRMPGLSGLDAARMLRDTCELNKRTPILAITANVSAEEMEECRQAGMQDHIGKPIRAAELVAKLSTWVGAEV